MFELEQFYSDFQELCQPINHKIDDSLVSVFSNIGLQRRNTTVEMISWKELFRSVTKSTLERSKTQDLEAMLSFRYIKKYLEEGVQG